MFPSFPMHISILRHFFLHFPEDLYWLIPRKFWDCQKDVVNPGHYLNIFFNYCNSQTIFLTEKKTQNLSGMKYLICQEEKHKNYQEKIHKFTREGKTQNLSGKKYKICQRKMLNMPEEKTICQGTITKFVREKILNLQRVKQ